MKDFIYCNNPKFYSELEHTADCALQITAPDLVTLFAQAAFGMRSLLLEPISPVASGRRLIEVSEPSAELALVSWLGELNFMVSEGGLVFSQIRFITFEQLNGGMHISAEIDTAPAKQYFDLLKTEIKAVTLYGLQILNNEGNFEVTVVFDI